MAHGTLRALAALCHFMVFASAVIVTGIASFFLNQWSFRGVRLVYQEVIVRSPHGNAPRGPARAAGHTAQALLTR